MLTLPGLSKWEGRWTDVHGYSGTWWAEVTTGETSPGVWHSDGNGEVVVPYYGGSPGHVSETLQCTGPTTDSIVAHWTDNFGDDTNLTGTLSIGSNVALESGAWEGFTFTLGQDQGSWEGEFHPRAESGGSVPGAVEVDSSSGTLINSFETTVATELPLLPSGEDIAPVGGVSFAASLPVGETIRIKLTLPPGSHPTSLLKLVGWKYVEMPATIAGETVEYEITDGGTFDEDHAANGGNHRPRCAREHRCAGPLGRAARGDTRIRVQRSADGLGRHPSLQVEEGGQAAQRAQTHQRRRPPGEPPTRSWGRARTRSRYRCGTPRNPGRVGAPAWR